MWHWACHKLFSVDIMLAHCLSCYQQSDESNWTLDALFYSHQLASLNLSHNRIHKLDELSEAVTKFPYLKTLNLSHNEVRVDAQLSFFRPFNFLGFLKMYCFHVLSSWRRTVSWTKLKAWSWWSCGWSGTLCVTSSKIRPHTSGQSVIWELRSEVFMEWTQWCVQ